MYEGNGNVVRFGRFPRYRPCETGIHVCGIDDRHNQSFTLLNLPLTPARAAKAFSQARVELADEGDGDFVVDMMVDGDIAEDFFIRRQLLPRLAEIVEAA
jgi:hypothetical protein